MKGDRKAVTCVLERELKEGTEENGNPEDVVFRGY